MIMVIPQCTTPTMLGGRYQLFPDGLAKPTASWGCRYEDYATLALCLGSSIVAIREGVQANELLLDLGHWSGW